MTRRKEVSTVSLSKLRLQEISAAMMWERAPGFGFCMCEWRFVPGRGRSMPSRERKMPFALLEENRRKCATDKSVKIVPGTAPEAMVELPAPTHVPFIGGASPEI